jgi:hypothetical protein
MVATSRSIAGRGTATATALLAALLLGPATAVDAAGGPTLRVTPRAASAGSPVVIRGRHWPVIEFCRPRVTVTMEHRLVGRIRPRPEDGSFARRWTVPASVPAGRHTIRATQRCESGRDGHAVFVTRATSLRVVRTRGTTRSG